MGEMREKDDGEGMSGTREELRAAVERLWADVLVPAATEMAADQGRRA